VHPAAHPHTTRTSVDELLATARSRLRRVAPAEARTAMRAGAMIIDIRSDSLRARDGVIPGARFVPRNVLEWRMDPSCAHRDPSLARPDAHIVLVCDEGYQSSLAAATLQELGLPLATDLIGGFQAWRSAGLPVQPFREGSPIRAIEFPCGHHLEGSDDDELFRLAREHVDRDHPEMNRSDAQLRERIASDAYDAAPVR
jgi:rhodanese-related sulfurtransferase/predicted small metal-binding protein